MPEWREPSSPYPGLRPFEPYEDAIFFGREAHTDRLLGILQRERFLAVLGPSGAGKSSLVRAGMLPALAAGWLGSGSDWRVAILRPGDRPFRRLAEALLQPETLGKELLGRDGSAAAAALVEAELRRGPLGLVDLVDDAARDVDGPQPWNLLVLVDQFEEIFRYRQEGGEQADEAEAFVNLLLTSRAPNAPRIYVALTMRTDFLGHCVRFLELPEAINRAQYLTPRLTRAELESAIGGPARVFGGDVAPELVNELINSVAHDLDQLPLLQHALARMWERAREQEPAAPVLALDSLAGLGGLAGALSAHAEQVLATLSPDQQRLAETLFRAITVREGSGEGARSTRRPQRLDEIASVAGRPWHELVPVIRAFAQEGVNFLSHGEPLAADSVIDISHEALIRQWERLRGWAGEEAERASEYRRWRDRSLARLEGGELLTGADLARAVDWRQGTEHWRPTREWAERYAARPATAELDVTLAYVAESEARERERQALEESKEDRLLNLEWRATAARAGTERARAEAAVRERQQAEVFAGKARRQAVIAWAAAAAAILLAAFALWFKYQSTVKSREALARQLATEAIVRLEGEPDLGQLLAVEAFRTLPLPETERVVRQAFVSYLGELRALRGHSDQLSSASFSPDGRKVVTASRDGTARLWDASTGLPLATLSGHATEVLSAAFSPDGRRVVTGSWDQTARLWDASTGRALATLSGHQHAVWRVAFSPDGRTVATASLDQTARLWDASTGRARAELKGHAKAVLVAAFSPDGRRVVTASEDGTARLWDAETGGALATLSGHKDRLWSAAFSADGGRVVTASQDGTSRVWESPSGNPLAILGGDEPGAPVFSAAFSPDGRVAATASADGTARLWDLSTGRVSATLAGHQYPVAWTVAFSPDGRLVVTAGDDRTARLWDASTGRAVAVLSGHQGEVVSAAFSPDGRKVVTASRDNTARLWNASTGSVGLALRGHRAPLWSAAFSPDGRRVVTASDDKTVRLWNASTGHALATLRGHEGGVLSAGFSADGRRLVTAGRDKTARLWDASTGKVLAILRGHGERVRSAAFSPDSSMVVTASVDKTARLWSATTGHALGTLGDHFAELSTAAFSPDGSTVVTASEDGRTWLWEVLTLRRLTDFGGGNGNQVWSAVFSPDGRRVLTAGEDRTARLWEVWKVSTPRVVTVFSGHQAGLWKAAFSRNGRLVVTASSDGTARLWDVSTNRDLAVLRGHQGEVTSAAFSPSGRRIVTASLDHTARVWACRLCAPTAELAAEIRCRVGRSLTDEERQRSGLQPVKRDETGPCVAGPPAAVR